MGRSTPRAGPRTVSDRPRRWPLFQSLSGGGWSSLLPDLVAGLTLAAIAIPEQMATAQLGGFPPQIGFIVFIAGSVAFAVFGASRFLSAGADSTITPIFAGSLALVVSTGAPHYFALAALLALMVGALLTIGGLVRAGWIADLLSVPVMTGFLAGVSIHIAVSQAPALLGLPSGHGEIYGRLAALAKGVHATNMPSLAIGLGCLMTVVVSEKISARLPGALLALAVATLLTWRLNLANHGVAVLASIPSTLPRPAFPAITFADFSQIAELAVLVTMIVMVQTAATSRSFPPRDGSAPDVNRDFIGVGAGSLLSGLLGAFPVDASPPRTAIVVETGGRTQFAGLVACAVVGATAAYGADLLAHAPKAALAGVLLFIAARIFRLTVMLDILRKTGAEFALVMVTMIAVVTLPMQIGVALAIMLSLIHGMWTTTRARLIEFERVPGASVWWPQSASLAGEKLMGVLVLAFQAPLSFLNAYHFQNDFRHALERADPAPRLVVLEASSIVEIDFTAASVLRNIIALCQAKGVEFAIARLESVRAQEALEKFGVLAELGEGHLFRSVDEATRALAPEAELRVD